MREDTKSKPTREACCCVAASSQPEPCEGKAGKRQVADRPVVAMKRLIPTERRGLSSRATNQEGTVRRLAKAYQLQTVFGNFNSHPEIAIETQSHIRPVTVDYEITSYCKSFDPIIKAMIDWGKKHRRYLKNQAKEK